MIRNPMNRRTVLASTATALGLATVAQAQMASEASGNGVAKYVPETSDFPYEVTRTEAEWREMLGDEMTYGILRQSDTEWPFTTDLWKEPHEAGYLCRGCDLPLYDANWFQRLEKGWVFFHHARVNAVMFGQDGPVRQYGQSDMGSDEDKIAVTEVHCRRCGSHTGHHLQVQGMYLHCINGTSLKLA